MAQMPTYSYHKEADALYNSIALGEKPTAAVVSAYGCDPHARVKSVITCRGGDGAGRMK